MERITLNINQSFIYLSDILRQYAQCRYISFISINNYDVMFKQWNWTNSYISIHEKCRGQIIQNRLIRISGMKSGRIDIFTLLCDQSKLLICSVHSNFINLSIIWISDWKFTTELNSNCSVYIYIMLVLQGDVQMRCVYIFFIEIEIRIHDSDEERTYIVRMTFIISFRSISIRSIFLVFIWMNFIIIRHKNWT